MADYLMHIFQSVDEFHNVLHHDDTFYQEIRQVWQLQSLVQTIGDTGVPVLGKVKNITQESQMGYV